MNRNLSRRKFLSSAAVAGAGLVILKDSRSVWGAPANERLNVAIVGVGGRGQWFVDTMPKMANVVALCDVNDQRAGEAYKKIPGAKKFYDFRQMLEEMGRQIDGVIIATPDHTHAVAASMAMKLGKHVYCEKPLTRDIHEARVLRELAMKHKVATQMGNQGTASESFRRAVEIIQSGALGEVRDVYGWNDGGGAAKQAPTTSQPVPDTLKWDLWLGPAADRAYHREWMQWHAWRDFGTGQLGNWAVHTLNVAFKAFQLDSLWKNSAAAPDHRGATVQVEAEVSATYTDSFPKWEKVRYDFAARGKMPPVRIHWFNGGSGPGSRQTIEDLLGRRLDWGDAGEKKWKDHAGILVVGSKGKLHANGHNTEIKLLPEDQFKDFTAPERTLPRSPGHEREWLDACKGGPPAMSNFVDYGALHTQFVLLGNVATQVPGRLEFDPVTGKFSNNAAANQLLQREYRKGWTL